jgi:uncharacterized protein YndB with AHSA1/START domain
MNTNQNTVKDINQCVLIQAPIQKVWEKVATAEGIAAWFMPNDFQPVEGHEFHLQSPFGPSPCKVLEIDEPNTLSFSWDTEGWVVSFVLKEVEGATEFTVIHGGWKQADEMIGKAGENAAVIRERMNGGWEKIAAKLKQVVEG